MWVFRSAGAPPAVTSPVAEETGLQHRANRQRELRLRGRAGSTGLGHDQQVRD